MLLGFCLVRHAVWLVHWRHVVHQGDGLHGFMNSAADGLADLGGCWSSGGGKVVAGLKTSGQNITKNLGNKQRFPSGLKNNTNNLAALTALVLITDAIEARKHNQMWT